MKLIINNDILTKYIPNYMDVVEGELDLFDKIQPALKSSELFLENEILGVCISPVASGRYGQDVYAAACGFVVYDALAAAVPSLDLILTPNGFGIVNTSNIAPASRDRVSRLIQSLERNADGCLCHLFQLLKSVDDWNGSEKGGYFAESIIPDLGTTCYVGTELLLPNNRVFANYKQLRILALPYESKIMDDYIGEQLYARFCREIISGDTSNSRIIGRIISALMLMIRGHKTDGMLRAIVDDIRRNPVVYPEWQRSRQREMFDSEIFENKKESSGYFF